MSKASVSVFSVGVFLVITGISFLIIPNLVLSILGIPATTEIWIRIVGMLALFLGYYYISSARKELIDFYYSSIVVRIICFFIFLVLVLSKMAYPILMIFGIIDLLGATWTFIALKKSKSINYETPIHA
jgi:hypothetical protein